MVVFLIYSYFIFFLFCNFDDCYVVHNSKAVVVKSEAFAAPDKESIKQLISDVIEKLRT